MKIRNHTKFLIILSSVIVLFAVTLVVSGFRFQSNPPSRVIAQAEKWSSYHWFEGNILYLDRPSSKYFLLDIQSNKVTSMDKLPEDVQKRLLNVFRAQKMKKTLAWFEWSMDGQKAPRELSIQPLGEIISDVIDDQDRNRMIWLTERDMGILYWFSQRREARLCVSKSNGREMRTLATFRILTNRKGYREEPREISLTPDGANLCYIYDGKLQSIPLNMPPR